MDIRVWAHEDRPMTDEECAEEAARLKEIRAEKSGSTRLAYQIMDRAYLKALKNGKTIDQAHDEGIAAHAMFVGVVIGALVVLIAVGVIGYFTDLLLTATTINIVTVLAIWLFVVGFWARKLIKRLWAYVRSKFKKEEVAS